MLITGALTDLFLYLHSNGVIERHALLLPIERILRDRHVSVLLDVWVIVLLRLVDDAVRVVELLDVEARDIGKPCSCDHAVPVASLDRHAPLLVELWFEHEIIEADRETM